MTTLDLVQTARNVATVRCEPAQAPYLDPCAGFVILDAKGEFLCWSACLVAALERSRDSDIRQRVARIERCRDGVVMMFRYARKKLTGSKWESQVPL